MNILQKIHFAYELSSFGTEIKCKYSVIDFSENVTTSSFEVGLDQAKIFKAYQAISIFRKSSIRQAGLYHKSSQAIFKDKFNFGILMIF